MGAGGGGAPSLQASEHGPRSEEACSTGEAAGTCAKCAAAELCIEERNKVSAWFLLGTAGLVF